MSHFAKIFISAVAAVAGGVALGYWFEGDPTTATAKREAARQEAIQEIEQNNKRVQDRLPPGCTINFYGWYRYHQSYSDMPIVAVICKKQDTNNLNWRQPTGKITRPELQFVIQESKKS